MPRLFSFYSASSAVFDDAHGNFPLGRPWNGRRLSYKYHITRILLAFINLQTIDMRMFDVISAAMLLYLRRDYYRLPLASKWTLMLIASHDTYS